MRRWKNLSLERQEKPPPVTKTIKPQLGHRQGRCRWVWGNYQALSDSSVPAALARAGDWEIRSPRQLQMVQADGTLSARPPCHGQLSVGCAFSQPLHAWCAGPSCFRDGQAHREPPRSKCYRLQSRRQPLDRGGDAPEYALEPSLENPFYPCFRWVKN